MKRFKKLGVIKNEPIYDEQKLKVFLDTIYSLRKKGSWSRLELIDLFNFIIPEFNHKETGNFLDDKM